MTRTSQHDPLPIEAYYQGPVVCVPEGDCTCGEGWPCPRLSLRGPKNRAERRSTGGVPYWVQLHSPACIHEYADRLRTQEQA